MAGRVFFVGKILNRISPYKLELKSGNFTSFKTELVSKLAEILKPISHA